jgi:hypothetical protein
MSRTGKGPARPYETELPKKDWFKKARFDRQGWIITFLLSIFGFVIVAGVAMFFLQGFHLGGFNLECNLLRWFGGATIGGIAGLLTIAISESFKDR